MQMACDREQPRAQAGVGPKVLGMRDQPQPGLFEQILSDVAAVRQSGKKVIQPRIERVVHGIKRIWIGCPQTADELRRP